MRLLNSAPLLAGIASVVSYTSMNARDEHGESDFRTRQVQGTIPSNASESRPSSRSGTDERGLKTAPLARNYQVEGGE